MEHIFAILIGLILLFLQGFTLYFMITYIKRIIVCSEKVYAKVTSVIEDEDKHRDSKTGKIEYRYSYNVTFKYDYNGQTYEATQTYDKSSRYSKGNEPEIKINPHNPKEIWTKGEFMDLLKLSLGIPLYVFLDLIYIAIVFD